MAGRPVTSLFAALALSWPLQAGHGQTIEPRLTGIAGQATDVRGIRSGAVSLVPSLLVASSSRTSSLFLSGRGTRFETGAWSAGGSAAFDTRMPARGWLAMTLAAAGDYTATSYDMTFASLDATSATELRIGVLALYGGLRGATARTTFETATPGPLPTPPTQGIETASLWGPVFGGTLRLATLGVGEALTTSYREERAIIEDARVTDRVAGVHLVTGRVSAVGRAGWREAPDERRSFGGVRIAVALTPALAILGSVESYRSNLLTGTLAGRTASAGISLRLGRAGRTGSLPRPAGAPAPAPGVTRLAIRAPDAAQVAVAGDWNRWTLVPARRAENGVWYVDLTLAPGEYRYAFRIDGEEWRVPNGAAAVDDGFGGKSAWVTVRAPARSESTNTTTKEE